MHPGILEMQSSTYLTDTLLIIETTIILCLKNHFNTIKKLAGIYRSHFMQYLILAWLFLHFVNFYILFHQVLVKFSNHVQFPDFSTHLPSSLLDHYPPAVHHVFSDFPTPAQRYIREVVLFMPRKGKNLEYELGSHCGTSGIEANAKLFGLS